MTKLMSPFRSVFVACVLAGSLTCQWAEASDSTNPNINLDLRQQASRFLGQATCGPTQQEIDALATDLKNKPRTAYVDWINAQAAKPVTDADLALTAFRTQFPPNYPSYGYRQHALDSGAVRAGLMISSDLQLRYRVAYALSEIFVVSAQGDLIGSPEGLCDWQDMLLKNAFGKFRDLLYAVTTHPCMGTYLTSAGNAKAGFSSPGSRPDENYAREVMQLFTIGLYQLKPNGNYVVAAGHLIPTYDNDDITELARVFTGMNYPKGLGEKIKKDRSGNVAVQAADNQNVRYGTMIFEDKRHDEGAKKYLDGTSFPAGRSSEQDISDLITKLAHNASTAPFISRALILRLVTSNPSPAYVQAVADTFVKTDGDLKAVVTAILLNPEARATNLALRETAGKLREPWLRFTQMARAFQAKPSETPPFYPTYQKDMLAAFGQFPLASTSVFNFFLPSYEPPGEIVQRNERVPITQLPIVAPEFQILHATTAIDTPNYFLATLSGEFGAKKKFKTISLDLTPQIDLATKPESLIDNVDTLLTSGMMSPATRNIILTAIRSLPDQTEEGKTERAKMAVYLTLVSPDYAIQK